MSQYRFGEFVLDSETRQLLRAFEPRHVSPKAFHLLEVLVSSRPRVWSKRELQDLLWPDTTVLEANLPNRSLKSVPRWKIIRNSRGMCARCIGMDMGSWTQRRFPCFRVFCIRR